MPARIKVQNHRHRHPGLKLLRALAFVVVACLPLPPIAGLCAYVYFARDLPKLAPIAQQYAALERPTRAYAADGLLIGEFGSERRQLVPIERMPVPLIQAFLAAEDERFLEHSGVDLRSILRAAFQNLAAGHVVQGASTLTQQLAKTRVGAKRSFVRKAREAILARRMEDVYSKSEILTLYLNQIYLGHGSYGVEAAAQNYFRKTVSALTLGEAATLSVLPPSPSTVNPAKNPRGTLKRRRHVLNRMVALGFITKPQATAAQAEPITSFPIRDVFGWRMPAVATAALGRLREVLGVAVDSPDWRHGHRVYTTVEPDLQDRALRATDRAVAALDQRQGYSGVLSTVHEGQGERLLTTAETYYVANGMLVDPQALVPETRYLGLVSKVSDDAIEVRVTPTLSYRMPLADMRWAGPYRADPRRPPKQGESAAPVSWKPTLKACTDRFHVGGVILVVATAPDKVRLTQPPRMQGAVMAWSPASGYVRAAVGGRDFDASQVDRLRALRQTGSTMKPIYYSLAYDLGLRPSYPQSDAPYAQGAFKSTGSSNTNRGMLTYTGLVKSRNTVSLRVSEYVARHASEARLAHWSQALHLKVPLKGNRAEILGGDETLWSMSTAFSRFQNGGLESNPTLIRKIVDRNGQILVDHTWFADSLIGTRETIAAMQRDVYARKARRVRASVAYIMRHNLRAVVERGTARRARKLPHPSAGKTGSLPYDVWFNGFNSACVTTAWVGADRRERVLGRSKRKSGVYGAGPPLSIFMEVSEACASQRPPIDLLSPVPTSVRLLRVDRQTGDLARTGGLTLPHRAAFVPTHHDQGAGSTDDLYQSETDF